MQITPTLISMIDQKPELTSTGESSKLSEPNSPVYHRGGSLTGNIWVICGFEHEGSHDASECHTI